MDYIPLMAEYGLIAVLIGIALFTLKRLSNDMRPIFVNIVGGVAKQAGSNATFYAVAIMFGLSSSLSAFYDVFSLMDNKAFADLTLHQYAALWAKVLNPFIVTVLAYATQSKTPRPSGSTTPPFPDKQPVT